MKYTPLKILIVVTFLFSCKKEDVNTYPNLICNPSFEINGQGSLECWTIGYDYITYPDLFSSDVPPNGGNFSLSLSGGKDVDFEPYVEGCVTNIAGNKIINLSAYVKSLYGGQPIYLWLEQVREGQVIKSKCDMSWAFNGWRKFKVIDTLFLDTKDSIRVKIIQTTGQNSGALVDLVEMTQIKI
ncbi:MAG TPA: hypothetical protein PLH91_09100 [Tenuifilaceae bacterium]|nr:hypothetical protein [Tenuifilaceae bacterium]HPI45377.1 hypothetical protein [Tenuifilaceae bacterium]HPN21765.1 hypothetical protein [Tenuifilaceae bacterium]